MKVLWKNDKHRFGRERRIRAGVYHWHLILFHWNICLGSFPGERYVDPIALFEKGLCRR